MYVSRHSTVWHGYLNGFCCIFENPTSQMPQPHCIGKNSQNSKISVIYYLVNLWLLQVFNRFIHLMNIWNWLMHLSACISFRCTVSTFGYITICLYIYVIILCECVCMCVCALVCVGARFAVLHFTSKSIWTIS